MHSVSSDAGGRPRRVWLTRVWQVLHQPLLLLAVAALMLALLAIGLWLPQLPGQYAGDPVESTRWLLAVQGSYGALGEVIAGLGLFDLTHSVTLRLFLAVLTLLLLVQAADMVALLQRMRHLPALLRSDSPYSGIPLPIPGTHSIYRRRFSLQQPPMHSSAWIAQRIAEIFTSNHASLLTHRQQVQPTETAMENIAGSEEEQRWLLLDRIPFLYLRFVYLAGIGVALVLTWLAILVGWEVTFTDMIPGSDFRLPARALSLDYQVASGEDANRAPTSSEQTPAQHPLLVARWEERQGAVATTGAPESAQRQQLRLGNVDIWVTPATPALLVESRQGDERLAALSLPNHVQLTDRLGFAFSAIGSEESILVPAAGVGLRIVRLREDGRFLVELVSRAEEQGERIEIQADDTIVVPLSPEEEALVLHFRGLPSLDVQVRYLPGSRLIWVALLLVAIGAAGFVRRPRFLLCQLGPWPAERSVLVVQSDDRQLMKQVSAWGSDANDGSTVDTVP